MGHSLVCSCLVLMLGCSEEPPAATPEIDACEELNAQRADCGLAPRECKTSYDVCYAKCQLDWMCADLASPGADLGISACLWNCSPRFTCDDGTEIYATFRCDHVGDCAGAEDEQDCPLESTGTAPDAGAAAGAGSTTSGITSPLAPGGSPPVPPTPVGVTMPDAAPGPDVTGPATLDAALDAAMTDQGTLSGWDAGNGPSSVVAATADASTPDTAFDAGGGQ